MVRYLEEIEPRLLTVFQVLSYLKEDYSMEEFLSYFLEKISEDYSVKRLGLILVEEGNENLKVASARGLSGDEIKSFHKNYPSDQVFLSRIHKLSAPIMMESEALNQSVFGLLAFGETEGYTGIFPLKIQGRVRGFLLAQSPEAFSEVDILVFNSILSLVAMILKQHSLQERIKKESLYDLSIREAHNIRFLTRALRKEISKAKVFKRTFSVAVIEISNYEEILYTNGFLKTREMVLTLYDFFGKYLRPFDERGVKNNNRQIVLLLPEQSSEDAGKMIQECLNRLADLKLTPAPLLSVGIAEDTGQDQSPQVLERAEIALEESKRDYKTSLALFKRDFQQSKE